MARLEQLHRILERTPNDPFLTYGIALEHKNAGEPQVALEWLDKTLALDARYCYAYYQKGQVLESTSPVVRPRAGPGAPFLDEFLVIDVVELLERLLRRRAVLDRVDQLQESGLVGGHQ